MFDDNGAITNEGIATKALHAQNYDVYMAQADQYAKAIAEINKSIANDPYNTKLLERREDLIESHRDAILAANDEKDALKDLAEDGFDALLDSLKDTIDEYEKALDSAKDLYDYQKNIDEQVKNISKLEKQLSAYSGDTSEESKKTVQQLKNDLKEAKDELQDTQYDRYVSDTKELLDDLVDNFEEFINERLDDIDKLLSDAIESANKNAATVADTITSATENVGATLSDSMKTIWSENSSKDVLANYSDSFSEECTTLNGILNEIKEYVARLYSNGDSDAAGDVKDVENQTDEGKGTPKSNTGGGSTTTTKPPTDDKKMDGIFYKKKYTGNKKKLKPNKYFIHRLKYKDYDWSMKARNEYFKKMGFEKKYGKKYEKIGGKYNKQLIAWMKKRGYASGVQSVPRNELAWTQENGPETIIRKSDGALLTQLKKGDSVLNRDATSNIWDMANNPRNFIARAMNFGVNWPVAKVPGSTGSNIKNSIDMEIVLPNVDMNHGYFEIAAPTKTQTQNSTDLLMKNDTGDKVKLLQHRLNILGNQLTEDGIWGVQTDQAVRNFQYNYGLAVDGIVGPKTQEKLISEAVVTSAKTISDYMLKNKWHYKGDGYTAKTTFAATKKLSKPGSSCSHFVSWVLQDVGLLQAGKILSHTKAGYGVGEKSIVNADKLIDCKVVYPNKSIDSYKSELKPGDVVVHDSSIGVYLLKDKKPAVLTGRNGVCINSKGQYVKMLVTSGYEWRHNVLAVVRANV